MRVLYQSEPNHEDSWSVIHYSSSYHDITISKLDRILGELQYGDIKHPVWYWSARSHKHELPFYKMIDVAMMLRPSVVDMGRIVCNLVKEEHERERASTTG